MSFEMTQNLFNMESKGLTTQNLSTNLTQCKHIGLLNNNNVNTEYRLHVDIRRVTFDFHPLFSLEHVHVQNLRQIIQAYELTLSRDQVNACIQRFISQVDFREDNDLNTIVAATLIWRSGLSMVINQSSYTG
ncbi:unnamed protein product [Schistosoma mattheei]|uniref:Uncharacterized protein n=1 Tax=Schistosoma mattheei TaxID=31246 RepID=A0A183NNU6_9TREM|nr:unnamed protein product [Schistosoma mattheei]